MLTYSFSGVGLPAYVAAGAGPQGPQPVEEVL